jgi:hypothetical protein
LLSSTFYVFAGGGESKGGGCDDDALAMPP